MTSLTVACILGFWLGSGVEEVEKVKSLQDGPGRFLPKGPRSLRFKIDRAIQSSCGICKQQGYMQTTGSEFFPACCAKVSLSYRPNTISAGELRRSSYSNCTITHSRPGPDEPQDQALRPTKPMTVGSLWGRAGALRPFLGRFSYYLIGFLPWIPPAIWFNENVGEHLISGPSMYPFFNDQFQHH